MEETLEDKILKRVVQWFRANQSKVKDSDGVDTAELRITLMCSTFDVEDRRTLMANIEERLQVDGLHGVVPD